MRVKVEFEVEITAADVTDSEVEDWLRFRFNDNGTIPTSVYNKFEGCDGDPVPFTFRWRQKKGA